MVRSALRPRVRTLACTFVAVAALGFPAPASAAGTLILPVTGLVSASASGTTSNGVTVVARSSTDGRFVVFTDTGSNLVPGLPGIDARVYVRDLLTDEVELISRRPSTGAAERGWSGAISGDGRYVVFATTAPLLAPDTGSDLDVYLYDRRTRSYELVSVNSSEAKGNGASGDQSFGRMDVSDDGRYVVFESDATNLVGSDTNGVRDVFRRDRQAPGTTVRVSTGTGGTPGNAVSNQPDMSADGRFVAFASAASNFDGIDDEQFDLFRKDLATGILTKVSVGLDNDPNGGAIGADISDDGRFVAFISSASDLISGDTNSMQDAFVRDVQNSTTSRISVSSIGAQLTLPTTAVAISPQGGRTAFVTQAAATPGDTNDKRDVFTRSGSTVQRASLTTAGAQGARDVDQIDVTATSVLWTTEASFATTDGNVLRSAYVNRQVLFGTHPTIEAFLTHQHQGFTGAAPAATISQQAARIRAGASPYQIIAQLSQTPSFAERRERVIRLYWAYFERRPDLGGLNYWLGRYRTGDLSLNGISQRFAQSSEFRTKYGNTTPAQFVTLVYQNVLERSPDASGLQFWVNRINAGTPRGQVMTSFSESSEGKRFMDPQVSTILLGIGMYGRIIPLDEFDAVVAERKAGQPRARAARMILDSDTYAEVVGGA